MTRFALDKIHGTNLSPESDKIPENLLRNGTWHAQRRFFAAQDKAPEKWLLGRLAHLNEKDNRSKIQDMIEAAILELNEARST